MPQTEIRVVSRGTGETIAIGQQGEICARGYAVMKGYDGDPDGTAQVVWPDGWLHTGDLGIMREDGCLHLTGRSRDVIIRAGRTSIRARSKNFSTRTQGWRGAGCRHP